VFTLLIGALVDRFSYTPAFVVAGTMPLLATAAVLLLIRGGAGTRSTGAKVEL
jgi:ACS family hexuronate transporter-like MFS transporter